MFTVFTFGGFTFVPILVKIHQDRHASVRVHADGHTDRGQLVFTRATLFIYYENRTQSTSKKKTNSLQTEKKTQKYRHTHKKRMKK